MSLQSTHQREKDPGCSFIMQDLREVVSLWEFCASAYGRRWFSKVKGRLHRIFGDLSPCPCSWVATGPTAWLSIALRLTGKLSVSVAILGRRRRARCLHEWKNYQPDYVCWYVPSPASRGFSVCLNNVEESWIDGLLQSRSLILKPKWTPVLGLRRPPRSRSEESDSVTPVVLF